eukprot:TRINITY_DN2152_c3_g2_i1.p1 TRINITY_DN2152_c3_g2~~TRINITY_DN2152_c3_g2_i1.p1  ORF type:complete len:2315 (-),score=537.97 TRINITY_DN2152_c3_g2_i1:61-7005(-)
MSSRYSDEEMDSPTKLRWSRTSSNTPPRRPGSVMGSQRSMARIPRGGIASPEKSGDPVASTTTTMPPPLPPPPPLAAIAKDTAPDRLEVSWDKTRDAPCGEDHSPRKSPTRPASSSAVMTESASAAAAVTGRTSPRNSPRDSPRDSPSARRTHKERKRQQESPPFRGKNLKSGKSLTIGRSMSIDYQGMQLRAKKASDRTRSINLKHKGAGDEERGRMHDALDLVRPPESSSLGKTQEKEDILRRMDDEAGASIIESGRSATLGTTQVDKASTDWLAQMRNEWGSVKGTPSDDGNPSLEGSTSLSPVLLPPESPTSQSGEAADDDWRSQMRNEWSVAIDSMGGKKADWFSSVIDDSSASSPVLASNSSPRPQAPRANPMEQARSIILSDRSKRLDLNDYAFDSEEVRSLCRLMKRAPTLECVRANSGNMGDDGAAAFAEVLALPSCSLKEVTLEVTNKQSHSPHPITSKGCALLAQVLVPNRKLHTLSLSGNRITSDGINAMVFSLRCNNVLRMLDLSYSTIRLSTQVALGGALCENNRLEILSLDHCNWLSVSNIDPLLGALKHNRTLQGLYVRGRTALAHSKQVPSICRLVRNNRTLFVLEVAGLSEKDRPALDQVLNDNKQYQRQRARWSKRLARSSCVDPPDSHSNPDIPLLSLSNSDSQGSESSASPREGTATRPDSLLLGELSKELGEKEKARLDFNGLRLACLPSGLCGFGPYLVELNLFNNRLTTLTDANFPELPSLTVLRLSGNQLTDIPSLANMPSLEVLDVSFNCLEQVVDRSISQCSCLRIVRLCHNTITVFEPDLSYLINLETVDLSYNRLSSVVNLGKLHGVKVLRLAHNDIHFLPVPILATSLTHFDVSHNKLQYLPHEVASLANLESLLADGNPLSTIPAETLAGGIDLIFPYLRELGGGDASSVVKLMLMGKEGVGKTSLVQSLTKKPAPWVAREFPEGTVAEDPGLDIRQWCLSGAGTKEAADSETHRSSHPTVTSSPPPLDSGSCGSGSGSAGPITFRSWDFTNQAVCRSTHPFFFGGNTIYLLVFDLVHDKEGAINYWLQSVARGLSRAKQPPIVVVGTHLDNPSCTKEHVFNVFDRLRRTYDHRFNIVEWLAVSNRTKKHIRQLRARLLDIARAEYVREAELSRPFALLLRHIELARARLLKNLRPPTLTWTQLVDAAQSLSIDEKHLQSFVQRLRDMGEMFVFDDGGVSNSTSLKQTMQLRAATLKRPTNTTSSRLSLSTRVGVDLKGVVFLDPMWLAEVFASVVGLSGNILKEGCLHHRHLEVLWKPPLYPKTIHNVLVALLQRFDVMYRLPKRGALDDLSIIPMLLPCNRPSTVRKNWPPFEDDLQPLERLFVFSMHPVGFFGRLVARTSHLPLLDESTYWRNGLFVRAGVNKALITFNSSLFTLRVQMRLGRQRSKLPTLLLDNINTLVDGWFKKQVDTVTIPCPHCVCEHSYEPFTFSLNEIELMAMRGQPYAYCRGVVPVRIDKLAPDVAMSDVAHLELADIHVGELIGQGSYAAVYRGTYNNDAVAVKRVLITEEDAHKVRLAAAAGLQPTYSGQSDDSNSTSESADSDRGLLAPLKISGDDKRTSAGLNRSGGEGSSGGSAILHRSGGGGLPGGGAISMGGAGLNQQEKKDEFLARFGEFRKEVTLMSGLDHPNLVMLKGLSVDVDTSAMFMITEFMECGDLFQFLKEPANNVDWSMSIRIASDIARGMNFLHRAIPGIIHRDLKSPNILIAASDADAPIVAKVADFGLSSMSVHTLTGREVVNPKWLAPEIMRKKEYTVKADVYSYGMILWEIIARAIPFDEYKITFSSQLEDLIVEDHLRPTWPAACPESYQLLAEKCWHDDPNERPTFEEILRALAQIGPVLAPNLSPLLYGPDGGSGASRLAPRMPDSTELSNSTESREPAPNQSAGSGSVGTIPYEIIHAPPFAADVETNNSVRSLVVVGDIVFCGFASGHLSAWAVETRKMLFFFLAHSGSVESMIGLTQANQLWTSAEDRTMVVWDVSRCRNQSELPRKVKTVKTPVAHCLLEVGKNVWLGSTDLTKEVIHVRGKAKYRVKKTLPLECGPAGCMLHVDPNTVWVGSFRCIIAYDVNDFTRLMTIPAHTAMIHEMVVVYDPPSDDLVDHDGGDDGKNYIASMVRRANWNDDSVATVWTASSDKTIGVWDLRGNQVHAIEGHSSRVFTLLRCGSTVWSAGWDKSIMVWRAQDSKFLGEAKHKLGDAICGLVHTRAQDTQTRSIENEGGGVTFATAGIEEEEVDEDEVRLSSASVAGVNEALVDVWASSWDGTCCAFSPPVDLLLQRHAIH